LIDAASDADMYGNAKLISSPEHFCWGCQISSIHKDNLGQAIVGPSTRPGSALFADIQNNPTIQGHIPQSYFPNFLIIACSYSKYLALIGMNRIRKQDVIAAFEQFALDHRPFPEYTVDDISEIHSDSRSKFLSQAFIDWALSHQIRVLTAAPEHHHQNGSVERPRQTLRFIHHRQMVMPDYLSSSQPAVFYMPPRYMCFLPHKNFTNS
jgi:hypothetical protein